MLIPFGILSAAGVVEGGATYELISTTILGTAAASVEFNNIPQDYKHLQLRISARSSLAANVDNLQFYLNNNTTNVYATHSLFGNGSSASANSFLSQPKMYFPNQLIANNQTASVFSGAVMDILDYSSTTKNTTVRTFTGYFANLTVLISLVSGFYNNTAAITRINFDTSANIMANSRFSLYGIRG
jgi:hypothetical protein